MKKSFLLFSILLASTGITFAQVDSSMVIQNYYKAHGWAGVYEQIMKADQAAQTAATQNMERLAVTQPAAPSLPLTTIQWAETSFDYGKINAVDSVKHVYKFKNTGSNPLKIETVKPACGCTAGKFSQGEIAPGAEGFVELRFSPVGKSGDIIKTATVLMNTDPANHSLTFKANIGQ